MAIELTFNKVQAATSVVEGHRGAWEAPILLKIVGIKNHGRLIHPQ